LFSKPLDIIKVINENELCSSIKISFVQRLVPCYKYAILISDFYFHT